MTNVKIYGEHDAKTIAQMHRCMQVGSAVAGVLCADGHLGYAHPIGGILERAPLVLPWARWERSGLQNRY